jgi:sporulation protein YlmC with PRC-barrel domain
MVYELNIMTNDGWVVTLISDKALDLGGAIISHIIVQSKADHDARVPVGGEPGVTRTEYRLGRT